MYSDTAQSENNDTPTTPSPTDHEEYHSSQDEDTPVSDGDNELNETLKMSQLPLGASLADGIDFSDAEAWESFSKCSPPSKLMGDHFKTSDTETSEIISSESSTPNKKELFDCQESKSYAHTSGSTKAVDSIPLSGQDCNESTGHAQIARHQSNTVVSRVSYTSGLSVEPNVLFETQDESSITSPNDSSTGMPLLNPRESPSRLNNNEPHYYSPYMPVSHEDRHVLVESATSSETTGQLLKQQLPPPSALISKLFPALRKERVEVKQLVPLLVKETEASTALVKAPSPTISLGGESGKGSSLSSTSSLLGDELRLKLCQLETEIERYRTENALLERLRKEKEEVCGCWWSVCVL